MKMNSYKITDSMDTLSDAILRVRAAQRLYASYSQEDVDRIFRAVAIAANRASMKLAQHATVETGMGIFEDKVVKNRFAAEYIYNAYKDTATCGIIERDASRGTMTVAEPMGLIAAVIPTTNPTSTAIFKILLAMKTRNGIILSPHPRAAQCTIETAKLLYEAAVDAGAPEWIVAWIDAPSLEMTNYLMREADMILATGGPGMVRAAYSSGKPAIGVGSGNTPVVIDKSADIEMAVHSILHSKAFDNGMICASEQAVIVPFEIYEQVRDTFARGGAYILNGEEADLIRDIIMVNGTLNAAAVGQSAYRVASLAGVSVPQDTSVLIAEVEHVDSDEVFSHEKLCPVLALYRADNMADAFDKAESLITHGGYGHTSALYADEIREKKLIEKFSLRMKTCRILINTPSTFGGLGDVYNFGLAPSLTLGCGTWGGNSVSENVGVKHLLNYKTVAERRENMQWFHTPEHVYMKRGCLPFALEEVRKMYRVRRVFLVTDTVLYEKGNIKPVLDTLLSLEMDYEIFYNITPDPTLACAEAGVARMRAFSPDCILAFGGGSAMDAAKIMWMLYEHPETDFRDLAMRFIDIRKRIYTFPKMGGKTIFVAVPTSAGTGSEVTPFAVITDSAGLKYPIADYALMPTVAVIDTDFQLTAPPTLTAAAGIDALVHATEAYVSVMATDYTKSLALHAIKMIFEYLPRAYEHGDDIEARVQMSNAATMAGMSFANAFLGICHSMAHKLGSYHHLPHGIANALLIERVMRYNAAGTSARMGTYPAYVSPRAQREYTEIADYLHLGGESDEEKFETLLKKIEMLKKCIGIKTTIRDYGVEEKCFLSTLDEMTHEAFDDQCTVANPRYPYLDEIKAIYLSAFYGDDI